MMKLSIILGVFIFASIKSCSAQENNKKLEVIYIYGHFYPVYNPCKEEVAKNFGFKEVMKGEVETPKIVKHNLAVEKILMTKNGKFWRLKYNKEIEKCPKNE